MSLTVDKTGNPIKVTGTTAAAQVISDIQTYIKFIYWLKPTTIGHLLTLTDENGNELAALRCEVADESQIFPVVTRVPDIYCSDMDSGTLYIYI